MKATWSFAVLALLALAEGTNLRANARTKLSPAELEHNANDRVGRLVQQWSVNSDVYEEVAHKGQALYSAAEVATEAAKTEKAEHQRMKEKVDAKLSELDDEVRTNDKVKADLLAAVENMRKEDEIASFLRAQEATITADIKRANTDWKSAELEIEKADAALAKIIEREMNGECGKKGEADLAELRASKAELEEKRTAALAEKDRLKQRMSELKQQAAMLAREIAAGQATLEETEHKFDACLKSLDGLNARAEEMRAKLARVETKTKKLQASTEALALLEVGEVDVAAICGTADVPPRFPLVAASVCSNYKLESVLTQPRDHEVDSVLEEMDELSSHMDGVASTLQAALTELYKLESKEKLSRQEAEAALQLLELARAHVLEQETALAEVKSAVSSLEQQRDALQEQIKEKRQKLTVTVNNLRMDLSYAEGMLKSRQGELRLKKEKLQRDTAKCDAVAEQLESARAALDEVNRDVSALRAEVRTTNKDVNTETAELQKKEAARDKVAFELSDATFNLAAAEEATKERTEELEESEKAIETANAGLKQAMHEHMEALDALGDD